MEELRLGTAREIITPPIGGHLYGYHNGVFSTEVHDDLTVTALAFEQGGVRALMISATVCLISTELSDEITDIISKVCALEKEAILLHATHTHSGPNVAGTYGWGDIDREYCESILIPKIRSAAKAAFKEMKAVKVGVAVGESLVGVNRRELSRDNFTHLGQRKWGCFNPEMTVMTFVDGEDKTLANIISYGAHGTAAGMNTEITRDWSGIMTDRLEKETGAVTAFFNSAEGDVGPRLSNGQTVGDIHHVEELGGVAAADAIRIYRSIKSVQEADIQLSARVMQLPLQKKISREQAQILYDRTAGETVNIDGQTNRYASLVLEAYEKGIKDEEYRPIPQSALRIGGVIFLAFPYELFSEIALRIDHHSKGLQVISLSNTNGSEGYFVTPGEIPSGGYEIKMFQTGHLQQLAEPADWNLISESLKTIEELGGQICIK